MKIPSWLKIGGRKYAVIFPYVFKDSSQVLRGLCDQSGQKIMVSDSDAHNGKVHPQSIEQTFMHEVIHAIDNVYCCGKLAQCENGEDIVDQLAEGIIQVFRDNKLTFIP